MTRLQVTDLWQFFLLLILLLLVMSMISSMLQQRERRSREKVVTYTILACVNNDYEERREFIPGDYVGKIVKDKRCPKDNAELRIKAIYAEKQQIGG